MSDGAVILAYFRYFLGCAQPCFTRVREAKEVFSGNASIEGAISIFLNSTFTKGASISSACIGIELFSIGK